MARPSDSEWNIVGYGTDPVPGDPEKVDYLASNIKNKYVIPLYELADELHKIKAKSNNAETMLMSKSGQAFVEMLGDFPSQISDLYQGSHEIQTGLMRWADTMSEQQNVADAALREAVDAYNDKKVVQRKLSRENDTLRRNQNAYDCPQSDMDKAHLKSLKDAAELQISQLTATIKQRDVTIDSAKEKSDMPKRFTMKPLPPR